LNWIGFFEEEEQEAMIVTGEQRERAPFRVSEYLKRKEEGLWS
jgi:hypothetical protein